MGKIILKTEIKRESGFLYYCSTDNKTGCLTVCQAEMARGKKASKKTVKKAVAKKVTVKKAVAKKATAKKAKKK